MVHGFVGAKFEAWTPDAFRTRTVPFASCYGPSALYCLQSGKVFAPAGTITAAHTGDEVEMRALRHAWINHLRPNIGLDSNAAATKRGSAACVHRAVQIAMRAHPDATAHNKAAVTVAALRELKHRRRGALLFHAADLQRFMDAAVDSYLRLRALGCPEPAEVDFKISFGKRVREELRAQAVLKARGLPVENDE